MRVRCTKACRALFFGVALAGLLTGARSASAIPVSLQDLIDNDGTLFSSNGLVKFTDFAYSDPSGLTPANAVFLDEDPNCPGGFRVQGSWQGAAGTSQDIILEFTAMSVTGAPFIGVKSKLGIAHAQGIEAGEPENRSIVSIIERVQEVDNPNPPLGKLAVFLQSGWELFPNQRSQFMDSMELSPDLQLTMLRIRKDLGINTVDDSNVPDKDTDMDGVADLIRPGFAGVSEFKQDFMVPEPGTLVLLACGLMLLNFRRRA